VIPEGVRLEKGQYELEVKLEGKGYVPSLLFRRPCQGNHEARAEPRTHLDLSLDSGCRGHYLRPSTEPLLTGEECRFSKTGRAQYEEETRDWKATLRAYKISLGPVFFVFQSKGPRRQWNRLCFRLSQQSVGHKPDR
jgi:hypothetical protein